MEEADYRKMIEQAMMLANAMQQGGGFGENAVQGGGFGENAVQGGGFEENAVQGGGFGENAVQGGGFGENAVQGGGFAGGVVQGGGIAEGTAQSSGIANGTEKRGGTPFGEANSGQHGTKGRLEAEKVIDMLRIVQAVTANEKAADPVGDHPMKTADMPDPDRGIQAVKAAIPYLEQRYQKKMWLFTKAMEIHKLLDLYGQKTEKAIGSRHIEWQRGMLAAIRPHLTPEKCAMVDMMQKLLEITEIMRRMEEIKNG